MTGIHPHEEVEKMQRLLKTATILGVLAGAAMLAAPANADACAGLIGSSNRRKKGQMALAMAGAGGRT